MSRIIHFARHLIEPAAGATFFALWIIAEAGRMSFPLLGEHHLTWIATLGLLSTGIGLVRLVPIASLLIPGVVLLAQFVFPAARFTENSWPAYLGVAVIAAGLIAYAPTRLRPAVYVSFAVYAVAIPVLLTVPWFGPILWRASIYGAPEALRNFSVVLGMAAFAAAFAWVAGTVLRIRTEPKDAEPLHAAAVGLLSDRENEVFLLAARGLSNAEIAARAFISESTVKSHMSHILAKLELASRAQLVAYAWENELVAR